MPLKVASPPEEASTMPLAFPSLVLFYDKFVISTIEYLVIGVSALQVVLKTHYLYNVTGKHQIQVDHYCFIEFSE